MTKIDRNNRDRFSPHWAIGASDFVALQALEAVISERVAMSASNGRLRVHFVHIKIL